MPEKKSDEIVEEWWFNNNKNNIVFLGKKCYTTIYNYGSNLRW
jgi:hypothetical protein